MWSKYLLTPLDCASSAFECLLNCIQVRGKSVPVTWHPGLEDVEILAQKVFNKDVSGFAKAWNELLGMALSLALHQGLWTCSSSR